LQALSLVEGLAARCAKGDEQEDKKEREAVMKSIMTLCQQVGTLQLVEGLWCRAFLYHAFSSSFPCLPFSLIRTDPEILAKC
jgi:hypothetical protein